MWATLPALGVSLLAGLTAVFLLLSQPFPLGLPPMALSTSVCFLVLSTVILVWRKPGPAALWYRRVALGSIGLFCLRRLYEIKFSATSWGGWIAAGAPEAVRIAAGDMFITTAVTFVLLTAALGFGLFAGRAKWAGDVGGVLATSVFIASMTWIVGYIYGSPLQHGLGQIPMRLVTSVVFFLASFGTIAVLGKGVLPVSVFVGKEPRARLLRFLIPTVGLLVLAEGIAVHYLALYFPLNVALVSMVSTLLLAAVLTFVISASAKVLGQDIEQAVKAQQWAEKNLHRAIEGLEATIYDRTADLRRSNESLEQFARVASHDLQEPLRKIRAFGDLLMKKLASSDDAEAKDYLQRMQKASTRMSSLIEALLTYSRLTTKAQPPAPVNLEVILEEVMSDLEVKIEDAGAKIEHEPLPVVEGDPIQMRQLFQNLLGNALKFHKPGVAPRIKVERKKIGDMGWEFRFSDNGIGFDPKYAERIFQVFERLHGKNEYEGTGIGLAICKRIVDRHHGKLVAEGRPGEGATFIFTLPASQGSRWAQAA